MKLPRPIGYRERIEQTRLDHAAGYIATTLAKERDEQSLGFTPKRPRAAGMIFDSHVLALAAAASAKLDAQGVKGWIFNREASEAAGKVAGGFGSGHGNNFGVWERLVVVFSQEESPEEPPAASQAEIYAFPLPQPATNQGHRAA